MPVNRWNAEKEYLHMAALAANLSVVNYTTECSVNDVQDYANSAQDGDHLDRMILVSTSHTLKLPNFLKNEMQENM